jgi:hypothetical protein
MRYMNISAINKLVGGNLQGDPRVCTAAFVQVMQALESRHIRIIHIGAKQAPGACIITALVPGTSGITIRSPSLISAILELASELGGLTN